MTYGKLAAGHSALSSVPLSAPPSICGHTLPGMLGDNAVLFTVTVQGGYEMVLASSDVTSDLSSGDIGDRRLERPPARARAFHQPSCLPGRAAGGPSAPSAIPLGKRC